MRYSPVKVMLAAAASAALFGGLATVWVANGSKEKTDAVEPEAPTAVAQPPPPASTGDVASVTAGNTAFACDLFARLRESQKGRNVFFSPHSISMAMAMCQAGAKGNTEKELAKALHFTLPNERLHPAFRRLAYDIQATPDVKIRIANGLCLAPAGGLVSGEFKSLLQEVYGAELFRAEDAGPVNAWVSRKTEGKIPKIIEMLSPDTACVILNAIYFKGGWPDKFDASLTEVQPFRLGGGKELKAPLMYRFGRTRLKAFEGFQAAELPYKGNGFSMVVLLPTEVDGLSKLEDSLTAENVKTWLDKLDKGYEQDIHLYLPKFKAETSYELVPTFESLGVRDAFQSGNADLSGIGGRPGDIAIARIVHKAFVEVNEEGTEAAAATAVMDVYTCSRDADRPSPPTFRADHPFVFLIRHKPSGAVLFIGRLANPAG